MSDLPGNPTPGQRAAADQKHAAVARAVDRLIAEARAHSGGTDGWIRLTYGPLVDAADGLSDGREPDLTPAALGIAAEALLRLARLEAGT